MSANGRGFRVSCACERGNEEATIFAAGLKGRGACKECKTA